LSTLKGEKEKKGRKRKKAPTFFLIETVGMGVTQRWKDHFASTMIKGGEKKKRERKPFRPGAKTFVLPGRGGRGDILSFPCRKKKVGSI